MRLSRIITAVDAHADAVRLLMLREPRGYPALCCNLLLPPCHPDADASATIPRSCPS